MEKAAMEGKRRIGISSRILGYLQRDGWFLSGMFVLRVCLLFRTYGPAESAAAKPPASKVKKATATEPVKAPLASPSPTAPKKNPVAALVNNEPITREELAKECLVHYGAEVLETLVNRSLIM